MKDTIINRVMHNADRTSDLRAQIWALRPKERVQVFTAGNVTCCTNTLAWSTIRVYQHQ